MRQNIPLSSISEFIQGNGAQLQSFDMGRRVVPIAAETFLDFERAETPYPYPLDRQAWFALLLRNLPGGHLVWFLRFPLDEQGQLIQAARDDFMQQLLERLGDNLNTAAQSEHMQTALQDNPYSFKPRDDRMAVLHARATLLSGSGTSKFYQHARDYFGGKLGWDQWPFVGYQGIADIVLRLDESGNDHSLAAAIPQVPLRPFEAVCHCLENVVVGSDITAAVIARAESALHQAQDTTLLSAAIRAIALAEDRSETRRLIARVLAAPCSTDPGILAAIGGRAWEALAEPTLAAAYLARLAENSAGQHFFDQCLSDLLFLPGMRQPLLDALRSPERSAALSQRIGAFFQSIGSSDAVR